MAYYGSIAELPKDGEMYRCNCVDGQCSGCGECCTDLLPVSPQELRRLKEYAKAHHLKEHRQAPFFDRKAVDLTCPFRNQQTGKCDVYKVRPQICRDFICSKKLEDAKRDRNLFHITRRPYSLRWEIFGNDEVVQFMIGLTALSGNEFMEGGFNG